MKGLPCTMFGGEDAEALNALMSALWLASGDSESDWKVYEFLEETPKTTMICVLYDSLKKLGYSIEQNQ